MIKSKVAVINDKSGSLLLLSGVGTHIIRASQADVFEKSVVGLKISLSFIEQAIGEGVEDGDGMGDLEEHALLTLSRAWGITMDQVYEWDRDHFYPVLERASEL